MTSTRSFRRRIRLAAVCFGVIVWAPRLVAAQDAGGGVVQQSAAVQMRTIAEQLGTKLSPEQRPELAVGTTLNGCVQDPAKLARLGLRGVHPGARVTAMRVSPQKLLVEVDDLDPEPVTRKATLRIDEQGRLSAP